MRLRFFIAFTFIAFSSFARVEYDEIENLDQSVQVERITNSDIEVQMPGFVLKGNYAEVKLKFVSPTNPKLVLNNSILSFIINGADIPVAFTNGEAIVPVKFDRINSVSIYAEDFSFEKKVTVVSLWVIVLPAILILALLMRVFLKRRKR